MRPRGIPRGKPRCAPAGSGRTTRFNEAAGNTPRKTSPNSNENGSTFSASMRPRGIPRGKPTGPR